MSRNTIIVIVIGLVLGVTLVYFFYEPKERAEEIVPTTWDAHYKHDSRDPYGTYLFYELLKKSTLIFETVEGDPTDLLVECTKDSTGKLLVVYGKDYSNNEQLWIRINEFLNAGNKALFILENDPYQLSTYYNGIFKVLSTADSVTTLKLAKEPDVKYEFDKLDEFKRNVVTWNYFTLEDSLTISKDSTSVYPGAYVISGYNYLYYFIAQETNQDGKPVLIETQYGNGSLLIHRTPLAFTNIALLDEKNVDHLEKILEEIQYEGIIYNLPPKRKIPDFNTKERKSPLQFILSNPALSWAYYLTLVSLFLFMIFNLKRKQAPIPMVPSKNNSTLEFVDALSKIYYQKHNNQNIVKHKHRIFITFIRTHYHIAPSNDLTELARVISVKSGVSLETVQKLLKDFSVYMKVGNISDEQLIDIHQQLDNFYKNCK